MADAIRETLLRYVTVRAAVLRPKSVESLINDLLPFADYLTTHHPEVTSLDGLDRRHIEGFLAWNRTRTWRGQRAAAGAGRTISMAVIQSTVLSLRNLLDDLTEWSWDQAPPLAADVPKLDQPLPRALAPDVDGVVMNAVAGWEDPFARIGLTVLRGAGLRVGELLDLELGSVVDYGPHLGSDVPEQRHQRLQAHTGIGELGGPGVPQLVRGDDQGIAAGAAQPGPFGGGE